jgi:hypothetical protein
LLSDDEQVAGSFMGIDENPKIRWLSLSLRRLFVVAALVPLPARWIVFEPFRTRGPPTKKAHRHEPEGLILIAKS